MSDPIDDLFIIGGGINGCGIARDAAGRGLSVTLAEKGDLAGETSSSSTKLFHGGLRYLEYFEFRLVREALIEREILLRAMPHISWPMRFVLPYHDEMRFESDTPTSKLLSALMPWMKGRRPAWLIRLGLFLYDNLGGRQILPATRTVNLATDEVGKPLKPKFKKAFEYSDCWVDDARLVCLNARDAARLGAQVRTRERVVSATVEDGAWTITLENQETGLKSTSRARMVVNAGGPWVADILRNKMRSNSASDIRLVRGSHIVTRKLFEHDHCYFFQGKDGRIIFAIPYETDYTLIGTTDVEHSDPNADPECSVEERDYLLNFVSEYLEKPVTPDDVVWSYSGVRGLYDDGASSASAATRDYVLELDGHLGAPALHVFGGKITTYRKLAEAAMEQVATCLSETKHAWTREAPLPGGAFPVDQVTNLVDDLLRRYRFLDRRTGLRLVRAYGTEAAIMLGDAKSFDDLGQDFGAGLTQREVDWLITHEFARTAEDVVWRRSKLGLRLSADQIAVLDDWMRERCATRPAAE
ncbi:MAG: glycerol-3-phosphate dehydrogenase [Alphaproteobacteria bacterium]|nr:glycerol-3-phosphate dehydrogenase [Alphaproteobacteria bacterium SS10]